MARISFSDFAHKLYSAIGAGNSTSQFTKTLFESIITDEGLDVLSSYTASSFKNFYNGNQGITNISKKINAYFDPINFQAYIMQFSDAARENLCALFSDVIPEPDIDAYSVAEKISALFAEIIVDAAGTVKKQSSTKGAITDLSSSYAFVDNDSDHAPDLSFFSDGVYYINATPEEIGFEPFELYLKKASEYISQKKTVLSTEGPIPFYDIYIPSNIEYLKREKGSSAAYTRSVLSNPSIDLIEDQARFVVIQGTGGIGKSMLMTHLFLSSASAYRDTSRVPVLISLKEYTQSTANIVDLIWSSIRAFDPTISQGLIVDMLESGKMIVLLDGLDEIHSSLKESFDTDLEAFIKAYSSNTVIISSRPVSSFVSYNRFSLFDLLPFTKDQSLALVEKIDYWDQTAKQNFLKALNNGLFNTHYQFASNPLLLTIMLMTYSVFGEVPAKMHVFYSKAYETMARLHDATKGSFQRQLHTKLSPEDFKKYFSEFCARSYIKEKFEFTEDSFMNEMGKVIQAASAKLSGINPRDFLLDATDNLCLMYKEGETYYFIHRSFQEFFTAHYFAYGYEDQLHKVGDFFDGIKHRLYTDRTFEMMYDMIPEKVARYIFLPFLEKKIHAYEQTGPDEEYWAFLEDQYPVLYYEEGNTREFYYTFPQSFLYQTLIRETGIQAYQHLSQLAWPEQVYDMPMREWVTVYHAFSDSSAFQNYPDPQNIPTSLLEKVEMIPRDELPEQYDDYFGEPETDGITIEIEIYELRKHPSKHTELRSFITGRTFPLIMEYHNVKKYYLELKKQTEKARLSSKLFDD